MKKELTCIICPMGCLLEADCEQTAHGALHVTAVTGNTCPRGEQYARSELSHPVRTVTSTVAIRDARYSRLPVITSGPVPKERIFDVMREIRTVCVCAPVQIHDIIIENICGLGVHLIASRSMERTLP